MKLAILLTVTLAATVYAARPAILPGAILMPQEISTAKNSAAKNTAGKDVTGPQPPTFPDTYTVKFDVSIPHLYLTQPQGLKFPVQVWYDGPNDRMRIEIMGGLDTTITVNDVEYTLFPRINVTECGVFEHGPIKGAARNSGDLDSVLPDLTGWDFAGSTEVDGKPAFIWQYQHKEGEKVSQYMFYTGANGEPIKFLMMGINYLTGGHYDQYNYEFTHYTTTIDAEDGDNAFIPPALCTDKALGRVNKMAYRHPLAAQLHALTPRVRGYDHEAAYHAFARGAGRAHEHEAQAYAKRLSTFKATVEKVRAHNADTTKSYKMSVNRFADWSQEEYEAIMLPNKARKAALKAQGQLDKKPDSYKPLAVFHATMTKKQLPRAVDWRGTGADPGVKDQGMCGSCFSFSATGSMEGTWYVATGQHRSFSEQQILDCSWDYATNGCGGGDYQPAFNYVAQTGGIALEQDYAYESNNDFCRSANHTRVGKFMGFYEVHNRDEVALMEAVYRFGPVAVAVDAENDSFRYYSEGVYDEPNCVTDSEDLDHAIVLFGYGTTEDGVDYWICRNSWAKFYGDDGYIKIKRGKSDCGISTDPAVAVVDPAYAVAGVAERKRMEAVRQW